MKRNFKSFTAVLIIAAMVITCVPMASGSFNVHAASAKKPAKVTGVAKVSSGTSTISIKWTKIKKNKNTKGYTIYRNGSSIGSVGKGTSSFTDRNLSPDTTYTYQVRAYNTYKVKQWYNKKTGRWQTKKPKSKKIRGKSKKVTKYKYGPASAAVTIRTSSTTTPTPTPTPSAIPRTKVSPCVDYLGKSHDMWKDANGNYWDAESKGNKITTPAKYCKNIDGEWAGKYGAKFIQKNGVTFLLK